MNAKHWLFGLLIVCLLVFAFYVWPTRYRYIKHEWPILVVRIDRVTGTAEFLDDEGWHEMKPSSGTKTVEYDPKKILEILPTSDGSAAPP